MTASLLQEDLARGEFRRIYAQEKLIEAATELIASTMEKQGVSKAQLAERTGTSRAHITQLLRGSRNMTLRTLADIMFALGREMLLTSTHADEHDNTERVFYVLKNPSPRRSELYHWPDKVGLMPASEQAA